MNLLAFIAHRLLVGAAVMVCVSVLVFFSLHLTPGDPLDMLVPPEMIGNASPETIARLRHQFGLDEPLYIQYGHFVRNVVTLNLGRSLRSNQPIGPDLLARYEATIELTFAAVIISSGTGIVFGVLSATHRDSWLDNLTRSVAFAGVSLPSFWLGLLFILLFAFHLHWLPISGRGGPFWTADGLKHLVLPAVTLSLPAIAILMRLVRSSMLEVLNEDYVRTARAKGLAERKVVYQHTLKNALIPVLTILGLQVGFFLGGSVVIETVFAWPGIGRYMIDAIFGRDFPVVQVGVLFVAATFVMINIVVDVLYGVLDPRVRYR